jgi:hypothetical protein
MASLFMLKEFSDSMYVLMYSSIYWEIFAVVVGIATPVIWLLLDNLSLPMEFINRYTIYVAIVFIIHAALTIIFNIVKEREASEERE